MRRTEVICDFSVRLFGYTERDIKKKLQAVWILL